MRATVAHRDAEPLRVADDDVGAHLAGWRDQRQREQVGTDRHQHTRRVRALDDRSQVVDTAIVIWTLEQRAKDAIVESHVPDAHDLQLDAKRLGTARHHIDRLRKARVGDEKEVGFRGALRLHAMKHGHRLGRGGGFIQERSRRDLHPGQVGHQRLEVEQRF